ncbi:MAG: hypothetical protein K2Y37_25945 [Pirellulales bacterium]|nr:hypothetical protein [Pirellulales bacterium]
MEIDTTQFAISLLLRWAHILAAITAVGGTIFMRLALLPTASELPETDRKTLHEGIRRRWAMWVHLSIGFLLVSGFYNYFVYTRLKHEDDGLYHGLFGIKFLLAMVIFFVASMLMGRSPAADRFRQKRKAWLTLNMALAIAVVLISGVMRTLPQKPRPTELAPATTAAEAP